MKNRIFKYGFLLLIPFIFLVFSLLLRISSGPFWLHADPSYGYYINAVHMLKGISPNYIDHPGTPVIILIYWAIRLLNITHSPAETLDSALLHPELYLYVVYSFMILAVILSSLLAGYYIYKKTRDKIASLLIQLPCLFLLVLVSSDVAYPLSPSAITNVCAEPLLISLVNLFNFFLLRLYFSQTNTKNLGTIIMLGLLCGLGLATKLTFIPLFLTALIIVSWGMKPLLILASAAAFVLGTLPIINQYPVLFKWITGLIFHSGYYGTGSQSIIDWHYYYRVCVRSIFMVYWFFVITIGGIFIWSLIQIKKHQKNRTVLFTCAASFGVILQYLFAAKHFSNHYLLPGINLMGSAFALFYMTRISSHIRLKQVTIVLISVAILLTSWQAFALSKQTSNVAKDIFDLQKKVYQKYSKCNIIPSSTGATSTHMSQVHALYFSNYFGLHKEDNELSRLYPNSYFYESEGTEAMDRVDGYGIRGFNKQRVFADDILSTCPCVIFLKLKTDFSYLPFKVDLVESSQYAGAYLLTSSTEKLAEEFYQRAVEESQNGNLAAAFNLALKSRENNYQPRNKIEYTLGIIYQGLKSK